MGGDWQQDRMLGLYRLTLAGAVALSHAGIGVDPLNWGVVAVVGFYLASGYVMTGLLRRHYGAGSQVGPFFADRALRLFPHYLAVAGLTLGWFVMAKSIETPFLSAPLTPRRLLENALVVPLNFFMFNDADRFTLIPPAWSLGAEIQFYVVIPFLLMWRLRAAAAMGSLLVFAAAACGVLNTDWYGYRLLPGILYVFLLGSAICDADRGMHPLSRNALIAAIVGGVVVAAAALMAHGFLEVPYNREILLGLAAGSIALSTLARRDRNRLDDLMGNLSYGVFLNHFLILWTVFGGRVQGPAQAAAFVLACVALAALTYYMVERPFLSWRRRIRNRSSPSGPVRVSNNCEI